MTKREKQLKLLRSQIVRQERNREMGIGLLVRATLELPRLRKAEARLATALLKRDAETRRLSQLGPRKDEDEKKTRRELDDAVRVAEADAAATQVESDEDEGIPGFLRRGMAAQKAVDGVISEEAKRLAALPDPKTKEKKAERRAIEKEAREANLRGQTRKWPATGKDALAQLK